MTISTVGNLHEVGSSTQEVMRAISILKQEILRIWIGFLVFIQISVLKWETMRPKAWYPVVSKHQRWQPASESSLRYVRDARKNSWSEYHTLVYGYFSRKVLVGCCCTNAWPDSTTQGHGCKSYLCFLPVTHLLKLLGVSPGVETQVGGKEFKAYSTVIFSGSDF